MKDKSLLYGGTGFLVGLAVGAGVGWATAPHSGARTRRRLTAVAEDVKERMAEIARNAYDATHRITERGKRLVA